MRNLFLIAATMAFSSVASAAFYRFTCTDVESYSRSPGLFDQIEAIISDKKYLKSLALYHYGKTRVRIDFDTDPQTSIPPTRFEKELRWTPIPDYDGSQNPDANYRNGRLTLPEGLESTTALFATWMDGHYDQRIEKPFANCKMELAP